jgi:DNA-binding GntR family transcriptional regulator
MQAGAQLIRPPSLTDAVVTHIRNAIINGEYTPGQQLAEATLAQRLGTSRGTVREAMRVLANLGLVSRSAHRGPFVTLLTPEKAREIYTLRALLESSAARTAAEEGRIDVEALATLERLEGDLAAAGRSGDVGAMVEADMRFHWELSALAGHDLLMEHLAAIQTHSRRLLVYSDLYSPDYAAVVGRHDSLMDALRTGDPDLIEQAIRDHITEVGEEIVAKMSVAAAALSRGEAYDRGIADDRAEDPLGPPEVEPASEGAGRQELSP